jgi:hypothetical protein
MPVSKTEQWIDWALQKAEGLPAIGGAASWIADRREIRRQDDAFEQGANVSISTHERDRQMKEWRTALPPTGREVMAEFERQEAHNEQMIERMIEEQKGMTPDEWEATYADTQHDYAEAYADVAGDATLSWRLEKESPLDILADVRREARGSAGIGPGPTSHDVTPTASAAEVIALMSHHVADQGIPIVSREQDNGRDAGIGR